VNVHRCEVPELGTVNQRVRRNLLAISLAPGMSPLAAP
jgi:hypothetical protein